MHIDGLAATFRLSALRKGGGLKKTNRFMVFDESVSVQGDNNAISVSGPSELDALMLLQHVDQHLFPIDRGFERGHSLLTTLDELHRDILVGDLSGDHLKTVQRALKTVPRDNADPHLNHIVQEIELRLAVEIAKIERAIL